MHRDNSGYAIGGPISSHDDSGRMMVALDNSYVIPARILQKFGVALRAINEKYDLDVKEAGERSAVDV